MYRTQILTAALVSAFAMFMAASDAKAVVLADLANDYQAAALGSSTNSFNAGQGLSSTTAGSGYWNYYAANLGGGGPALLTYRASPGNSGQPGYGDVVNGVESFFVPAISKNFIFGDGPTPVPAGFVNIHPGNEGPVELVARWTAAKSGTVDVAGTIRKFLGGSNGVNYSVRVNGVTKFTRLSNTTGRAVGYNWLTTVNPGDTIDIVYDPNSGYGGDESPVRHSITEISGRLIANLAGDYHELGQPINAVGAGTGTGTWRLYASDNANVDATPNEQLLTVKPVGGAGNTGYGGVASGGTPAFDDVRLYPDGEQAILDQELSIHPGDGALNGYAIARWTAGAGDSGLANVVGNFRNSVIGGDGVTFSILRNGVAIFNQNTVGSVTPMTFFDLTNVVVTPGTTLDFVTFRNGAYEADESNLAVFIGLETLPEPSSLAMLGLGCLGLARLSRRQGGRRQKAVRS